MQYYCECYTQQWDNNRQEDGIHQQRDGDRERFTRKITQTPFPLPFHFFGKKKTKTKTKRYHLCMYFTHSHTFAHGHSQTCRRHEIIENLFGVKRAHTDTLIRTKHEYD